MLATPKFKCHWGQFLHADHAYYAGIRLWRNDIDICPEDMPVCPISSADIEQYKQQFLLNQNPNAYQYWANFYAQKLLSSQKHFLHQGDWKIYPVYFDKQKHNNTFCFFSQISFKILDNIDQQAQYFDWDGFPFKSVISLKNLPDEFNGRVKWWRKKIIENTCPPILFWWHAHMQCFVLVDGHARLKAYQLENKLPMALCVSAIQFHKMDNFSTERIKQRLSTLQGLKRSLEKKEIAKEKIDLKLINDLVMNVYQDHSYESLTSIPKVLANLDAIFQQDLSALLLRYPQEDSFLRELSHF
ncbi:hypothetical protein [Acinetobacter sp. c3-l95]|uniref:hypothetical protein n=1 Tax=Acinetobacter sp. c3-l95 TaxID=3342804 RepID=UPI0035B976F9